MKASTLTRQISKSIQSAGNAIISLNGHKEKDKEKEREKNYFIPDDATSQFPRLFINCIQFLEDNALECEGILRLSGRVLETKAIKALIGEGTNSFGQVDVNSVASILKSFFGDSPQSLLTPDQYSSFVKIGDDDKPGSLITLKQLLSSMPAVHQRILHRLMIFLNKVAERNEINKMDIHNIAIIFAPLLIRPTQNVAQLQFLDNDKLISLIKKIITHSESLFEGIGMNIPMMAGDQTSRPVLNREIFGQDMTKDRVKVRFQMQLSLHADPSIKGTVSLYLKWTRGLTKKDNHGKTKSIVCTDPSDVSWEETLALECTLLQMKKSRNYIEKNITFSVREVREKSTKTIGSVNCNLADFLSKETTANNPCWSQTKRYDLLSKTNKGLSLKVTMQSEWLRVNSKLLLKDGNMAQEADEETDDTELDVEGSDSIEEDEMASPQSPDRSPDLEEVDSAKYRSPTKLKNRLSVGSISPKKTRPALEDSQEKEKEGEKEGERDGDKEKEKENEKDKKIVDMEKSRLEIKNKKLLKDMENLQRKLAEKQKEIDAIKSKISREEINKVEFTKHSDKDQIIQLRRDFLENSLYTPQNYEYTTFGDSVTSMKISSNILSSELIGCEEEEGKRVLEKIGLCIQQASKESTHESKHFYWLNTSCSIIHTYYENSLFKNEKADPSVAGVSSFFQTCDVSCQGSAVLLSHLQKVSLELYETIVKNVAQKLEPLLLPLFLGRSDTKGHKGSKKNAEQSQDISELTNHLEQMVSLLETNKICQALRKDMFLQLFEFLDETVFSGMLLQKRLYSTDAVRLRVVTSSIEQWIRHSNHFMWVNDGEIEFFKLVQETANLLVIDKEKLVSESFLKASFKHLDTLHVSHIVEIFATDENSKKPAPAFVVKTLNVLAKSDRSIKIMGALTSHLPKDKDV